MLGFPHDSDKGHADTVDLDFLSNTNAMIRVDIMSPYTNYHKTINFTGHYLLAIDDGFELEGTTSGQRGLYINASQEITVVITNVQTGDSSGDTYTAIPIEALGTKYIVAAYVPHSFTYPSEYQIVAVYDNTAVTIVDPTGRHNSTRHLDRFGQYQFSSSSEDPSGTIIISDKKISVFSGVTCGQLKNHGYSNGCDYLMTQLPPVTNDTSFKAVIVPELLQPAQDYIYRIYAESSNVVRICSNTTNQHYASCSVGSVFRNNFNESTIQTSTSVIYGNGSFFVAQIKGQQPFQTTIPNTQQYLKKYQVVIPTLYTHRQHSFCAVITKSGTEDGIYINGNSSTPSTGVSKVPAPLDDYVVATISMSTGHYEFTNRYNVAFGLVCYGYATSSSSSAYGYVVGFAINGAGNATFNFFFQIIFNCILYSAFIVQYTSLKAEFYVQFYVYNFAMFNMNLKTKYDFSHNGRLSQRGMLQRRNVYQ